MKILHSIKEENQDKPSESGKKLYVHIIKKCNESISKMQVGMKLSPRLISKKILKNIIDDIEAIRLGNFIIINNQPNWGLIAIFIYNVLYIKYY